MKIGIVTIYKCYNYGSFFQAYGLQKYLEGLGHTVKFLPIDSWYNMKYRLRKQFNRDWARDWFSLRLLRGYCEDWKLFNIAGKNEKDFDLIIIGSDEIWNINNKTFLPAKEYYGLNLPCNKVISYASCVGRSRSDDFRCHEDLIEGIRKLDAVSARDDATEEFLKTILPDREIPRVLDPSFLIDWDDIAKPCSKKEFILVYTYDGSWGFSEEQIEACKIFAMEKGLRLISVGFKNDWCDESIACSPREFLGYLRNADYVITSTFHGVAMSIQHEKQFVCLGVGSPKVEGMLNEAGLQNRMYFNHKNISNISDRIIDYTMVRKRLLYKIDKSKFYLLGILNAKA